MEKNTAQQIDWVPTLFLTLTPIAAVVATVAYFLTETFNPWFIAVFIFFYYACGLSITAGYHRLFSHKSYEANTLSKLLFLLFGAGAFQNSVKKWGTDHRIHHRYVDEDKDPYCIKKGFWYAHIFWMCLKSDLRETRLAKNYSRDFDKDPLIQWQDKYYVPIAITMGFGLPTFVGYLMGSWLGGFVFGGVLRMVIVHHFTFFINSLAHYWGRQPYTDTNTARDNGVLAFFTYGEGYHNFHHIFHADYRNGIRWYHWDPTKWMIKFMSYIKWAEKLKVTPEYEVFKARMIMAEKRLALKKAQSSYIDSILEIVKTKAEEANQRLDQLMADYEEMKKQWRDSHRLEDLRRQIEEARAEFRLACRQWQLCLEV